MPSVKSLAVCAVVALVVIYADRKFGLTANVKKLP